MVRGQLLDAVQWVTLPLMRPSKLSWMPSTRYPWVRPSLTNERTAAFMPHAGAPMFITARLRDVYNRERNVLFNDALNTLVYGYMASDIWLNHSDSEKGNPPPPHGLLLSGRKEGNVLFNDALNTFYLRLYGVRHMVKDHSDSEKGTSAAAT